MLENFPILKKIFKFYITCCIIGLALTICYLFILMIGAIGASL